MTLSPKLRHCDARYLVAYGSHDSASIRIDQIVVSTGQAFFEEFRRFEGLVQNKKLQLGLPADFFNSK